MNVGDKLKTLRNGRTQEEVAMALGISKSAWAMYERGERIPRDEIKVRIANYFHGTIQDIFLQNKITNCDFGKIELKAERTRKEDGDDKQRLLARLGTNYSSNSGAAG